MVRGFVDRWTLDHPDLAEAGGKRRNALGQLAGNDAIGAVMILHERTRLADIDGRGVSQTTIRRIMSGGSRTTELRVADALLAAIEQPQAFHDGTLTILPNPVAAPAERASCCGGSLTGSF